MIFLLTQSLDQLHSAIVTLVGYVNYTHMAGRRLVAIPPRLAAIPPRLVAALHGLVASLTHTPPSLLPRGHGQKNQQLAFISCGKKTTGSPARQLMMESS